MPIDKFTGQLKLINGKDLIDLRKLKVNIHVSSKVDSFNNTHPAGIEKLQSYTSIYTVLAVFIR